MALELPYYAIASDGSISFFSGGPLAQRPEPGQPNRLYIVFEPTGNYLSRDTGAGWENVGSSEQASSILAKLLTVDGAGSLFDSDLLDGLEGADYLKVANKGIAGGVGSLDANGKQPVSQVNDTIAGGLDFQTTWNAATNTPNIATATKSKGDFWVVSVGGTTALGGISEWAANDWAVWDGASWRKVDNTDQVQSVDGRGGAVTLSDLYAAINDARLRTIRDEGMALTNRAILDFIGTGVIVEDDSATGRTKVTISGAAAGMASEAAAGIVRGNAAASDPANPYVYFRSDPIHAGFRDGCVPHWQSATDIRVRPGAVWIPSLRRVVDVPTELSIVPTLAANTLGYLYVFDNAGTAAVELSTTAPVNATDTGFTNPSGFPLRGACRVKGPVAGPEFSRRFVGTVLGSTANNIHPFRYVGNLMRYRVDHTASPFRRLSGGGVASNFAIDFSPAVPPTSRLCVIYGSTASGFFSLQTDDDLITDTTNTGSTWVNGTAEHTVNLNAIQRAIYNAGTVSNAIIDTRGFYEER